MKTSETILEITTALMAVNGKIKNLSPDANGYNYKYLTLHKLIEETKPILIENNILCIQSVGQTETGVSITTRLQHISGEFIEDTFNLPPTNSKTMNDVQAMGSSISYGRRYGMGTILGITVDEDTDGKQNKQDVNKTKPEVNIKRIESVLNSCGSKQTIDAYSKEIATKYNISLEQGETIKSMFDKRRSEI